MNKVRSIGKGYQPWLILSVVILVGSLVLLAVAVTASFLAFGEQGTPLWVIVIGVAALLGIGLGFGGFVLLMAIAGLKSFRDERKAQMAGGPVADSDPEEVTKS